MIQIERHVDRSSSSYTLVAFVDASSVRIAVVIYIHKICTNKVSFLPSKEKIVGKLLVRKHQDCGKTSPIDIKELVLYSDSTTFLQWIDNHVNKLEKINQKSTCAKNRKESIWQKYA